MLRPTTVLPPIGLVVLLVALLGPHGGVVLTIAAVLLAACVLSAVHHAEVVAHRVGEPFGSLILAVSVTVIEVALIVTLMLDGGPDAPVLARDTVFAAMMISINGITGLSLFLGARTHHTVSFNAEGTGAALATVVTVGALCLVLPTFTVTTPGPEYSTGQLAFAAVASLLLYVLFVVTQTVRHRDFFLPVGDHIGDDDHADPPSNRAAAMSLVLLFVSLVAVVGLAKVESTVVKKIVENAGLPAAFVGVVIALLVLMPETLAAVRAALRNRTQISLNLAIGSAVASVGLTIPTIAMAMIWLPGPLYLGLSGIQIALLATTAVVSGLTIVPGRATRLQGGIHLVLLMAFLVLSAKP